MILNILAPFDGSMETDLSVRYTLVDTIEDRNIGQVIEEGIGEEGLHVTVQVEGNRTLISRISNGKPLVVDEFGKSWFRGVDASGRGIYSYTQNGIVKGSGYTNLSAAEIIAKYSVK